MTIADEIMAARRGWTDCGISTQPSPSLVELADEFSLATDPSVYHEVDAAEALRLVKHLLEWGLAYGGRMMKPEQTAELAERFLSQFGTEGTRYYTNCWPDKSGGFKQFT